MEYTAFNVEGRGFQDLGPGTQLLFIRRIITDYETMTVMPLGSW